MSDGRESMTPEWAEKWLVWEAFRFLNIINLEFLCHIVPMETTLAQVWKNIDCETQELITSRRNEWTM